jgi:mannitol/fructose-specific phosphotransferase system IIA component (Ntr-type)
VQLLNKIILSEENILFFEKTNRNQIIQSLVETISDKIGGFNSLIVEKVLEREKIVSTAIGKAIAIPHARVPLLENFALAIGICKDGVEWETLDGEDVKIICLVAGPEDKASQYLSYLSSITCLLNDEEIRLSILNQQDKKKIVNIFVNC